MDNETRIIISGQNNSDKAYQDANRSSDRFAQEQTSRMSSLRSMFSRAGKEAGRDLGNGIADGANRETEKMKQQTTQVVRSFPVTFHRLGIGSGEALGDGIKDGVKAKVHDLPKEQAKELSKGDGEMHKTGESLGSKLGGKLKAGALAAVAGLAAAMATVGALAGAALIKGVHGAMDNQVDNQKLAAQLGLNPAEAARAGKLAGSVYAGAYGDSLASVNEAVRGVSLNIGDMRKMGNDDVELMTQKALDLAGAFDVDVAESTRAVGKLMKTGLAKNATEAFDLITRGYQSGVDEAGDLIDTINEYSTQFRELGISGPKALGMMSQALKAGARDADTAADAIKEFAIRSKDGSKSSQTAFESLHFNAKNMFSIFARGGPEADKAMLTVIQRIKAMKDPVERNATAVGLFGTKAEDLQQALYAIDPTTAVAALGKVEGASKSMGDTLNDTASGKIESFKRGIEMKFNEMGAGILDFFKDISNSPGAKKFMKVFRDDILPLLKDVGNWINQNLVPAIKNGLSKWLEKGAESMGKLKKAIEENKPELLHLVEIVKTVAKAIIDFATSDAMTSGLGIAIDLITLMVKGIAAMEPVWSNAIEFAALFGMAMITMLGKVIDAAAWAFGWIPGLGPKLKNAQKHFHEFANAAMGNLNDLYKVAKKPPVPTIKPHIDLPSANAVERWVDNLARTRIIHFIAGMPSSSGSASQFMAHGGISGAATGGARGGMTWVGEQGPELVRLPYGSMVHPAGSSREMARDGAGGPAEVRIIVDLRNADQSLKDWIKRTVSVDGGGSVQVAFG